MAELIYEIINEDNLKMEIKGLWWKLLAVIIFIYVLIGGMTTPLKSGVYSTSPTSAKSGTSITLQMTGYNTHLMTAQSNRAWLKLDSIHAIQAKNIEVINEREVKISFDIPEAFPVAEKSRPLTLIVDNEIDGVFVQPNALFVTISDTVQPSASMWLNSEIGQFHSVKGTTFPYRNILHETIRNTFFHVALWFAMFILLITGLFYAVRYLIKRDFADDIKSSIYTKTGTLYGILGLMTGSVWAKFTWNTFWTEDIKLNMTAIAILIYLAYFVLRGAISDTDRRAQLSASYNVFAFIAMIPLLFIIPRMTDSLHPGNGGNPALGGEDLDNTLRMFFYPSIIALTLIGVWMSKLKIRYELLKEKIFQNQ